MATFKACVKAKRKDGFCLVLAKVDTFMNNKKCVKQCERVQQSTARSSN